MEDLKIIKEARRTVMQGILKAIDDLRHERSVMGSGDATTKEASLRYRADDAAIEAYIAYLLIVRARVL